MGEAATGRFKASGSKQCLLGLWHLGPQDGLLHSAVRDCKNSWWLAGQPSFHSWASVLRNDEGPA